MNNVAQSRIVICILSDAIAAEAESPPPKRRRMCTQTCIIILHLIRSSNVDRRMNLLKTRNSMLDLPCQSYLNPTRSARSVNLDQIVETANMIDSPFLLPEWKKQIKQRNSAISSNQEKPTPNYS